MAEASGKVGNCGKQNTSHLMGQLLLCFCQMLIYENVGIVLLEPSECLKEVSNPDFYMKYPDFLNIGSIFLNIFLAE